MRYVPGLIPKESKVLPGYFKGNIYKPPNNNRVLRFLGWFFGIFFLLGAIVQLHHPPLAFFYGFLGILLLPPGHNWIERKFRFRFRTKAKAIFCAFLLICAAPLILHYGEIDRKVFAAEQERIVNEEKAKAGLARQEQVRRDSLGYFIRECSKQRQLNKAQEASRQLQLAAGYASTPEEKQLIEQENDRIAEVRMKEMMSSGKYQLAISELNELIGHNPKNADLLYTRALCYSHTGKVSEAVQDCDAAAELGNTAAGELNDRINPVVKHVTGYVTLCCDGTISYATGRGACSHHGGVCNWHYPVYEESRKYP